METFPYKLFSKYDNINDNSASQQQSDHRQSSPGSLDSNVNRIAKSIAKSIANTIIRSAENTERQVQSDHRQSSDIKLPQVPKEVILFGAVIISKVLLFWAYKKAQDNGLEIMDL